ENARNIYIAITVGFYLRDLFVKARIGVQRTKLMAPLYVLLGLRYIVIEQKMNYDNTEAIAKKAFEFFHFIAGDTLQFKSLLFHFVFPVISFYYYSLIQLA